MHDSTIVNEAATVANTVGKALWLVGSGASIQRIFRKCSATRARLSLSPFRVVSISEKTDCFTIENVEAFLLGAPRIDHSECDDFSV
jgi:hypothetical protein